MTVSGTAGPVAAGGGTTTVRVTTQPECAWHAVFDAGWIADVKPASGQGSAQVQIQVSANVDPNSRRAVVHITGADVEVIQDAAACGYEVSPETSNVSAAASTATIVVTTHSACSWSVIPESSWITVTSPASGTGNGIVTLNIAANAGEGRVGTVTIAGRTTTIQQGSVGPPSCSYTVGPTSQRVGAAGGVATPVSVSTGVGCPWAAIANVPWLSVTSGATGSSNGDVSIAVSPNPSTAERTGTLTIAGRVVTVVQAAATVNCTFALSSSNQTVASTAGAAAPVAVATSTTCGWTAVSNVSWITVTGGSSGTGNGTVTFSVTANTGAQRAGTLSIAGQTYTVTQLSSPTPCSYAIAPAGQSIGAAGGSGSPVAVTTTSTCVWTASSNAAWITVNTGATGTGNGTVTYTVAANQAAARTGTMTIAGQTFTVTQAAAPAPCTYAINPPSQSVAATGGSVSVSVTAGSGCAWTATSNNGWLSVTGGSSGSGNGTVSVSVAAHTGGQRTGTVTIAGQTFTVSQAAPCTYSISPKNQDMNKAGGAGTPIAVTTSSSCSWTATSNDSWITVTGGASGTGNGTVTFTVASNNGNKDRDGTISIATQTFTVQQKH